jgi:hypothetical protein
MNGRIDPDRGEGVWVATLDVKGEVVGWEQRLDASPAVGYILSGAAGTRTLLRADSVSTRLVRLRATDDETVSDSVELLFRAGVSVTPDGKNLVATGPRGPVEVSIADGTSTPLPIRPRRRVAVRQNGRLLVSYRGSVLSIDRDGSEHVLLRNTGDPMIRCDVIGKRCFLIWRTNDTTIGRVLHPDDTLGPPVMLPRAPFDVALSPDGTRVAASGPLHHIDVIELATGRAERWPVNVEGCIETDGLAWGKALIVSIPCRGTKSKVFELTRDGPGRLRYEGEGWVGAFALAPNDEIYAIVRRLDSQPVFAEGL